jgi:hypothetical protein
MVVQVQVVVVLLQEAVQAQQVVVEQQEPQLLETQTLLGLHLARVTVQYLRRNIHEHIQNFKLY